MTLIWRTSGAGTLIIRQVFRRSPWTGSAPGCVDGWHPRRSCSTQATCPPAGSEVEYPSWFVACSHRTPRALLSRGAHNDARGSTDPSLCQRDQLFWPAGRILPTTVGLSARI